MDETHVLTENPSSFSATRRLVCAIALLPIVPAVAIVGAVLCDAHVRYATFDLIRWFHLFFPFLWVTGTIVIWRAFVLWTLGRRWLTALIAFIPFMQVIYAKPLWDAGCVSDDILRVGQHQLGVSVWVWLSIWAWWGWERNSMSRTRSEETVPRLRISSMTVRLAASIATIPFVFGVFLVVLVAFERAFGLRDREMFTISYTLAAAVAVGLWLVIWKSAVVWSDKVIRDTVAIAILFLAVPIGVLWAGWPWAQGNNPAEVILGSAPVIGWGFWMATSILVWPIRRALDEAGGLTPKCLKCGYLLKGLTATRCPECGSEPTLDELWSGNCG